MRKFSLVLAMLAIVLVFGLVLVSCGGDDGNNNTPGGNTPGGGSIDPALNGTWVKTSWVTGITDESLFFIFNNGNFEQNCFGRHVRGTYTISSGSEIILKSTDIYFDSRMAEEWNSTVGWKSKSQFAEILRQYYKGDNVEAYVNGQFIIYGFDAPSLNYVGYPCNFDLVTDLSNTVFLYIVWTSSEADYFTRK